MAESPPDRITISIPESADVDRERIDELVRESEYGSRSEYIRAAIEEANRDDDEDK